MTRMAGIAVVGAALALGGCTSAPEPTASPSSTFTSAPTPSQIATTSAPLAPAVTIAHGTATVLISGQLKSKLTLPIGPNGVYQPAPGTFRLSFLGRDGNALILGGDTPSATARTSPDLTLSIVIQADQARAFSSARGECTITVTGSTTSRFEAKFACAGLTSQGKTIHATGSFVASA
ncbi:MAG: hypothetical protein ABR600_12610 [Actinomycetota bacterium]|nr:hypothetical protein [Actinomycetota bacterium]